jgi:hypothetical protein
MNDQLQAQLVTILAKILVSVGELKDFSLEQLPDIVQQYIAYGYWKSVAYICLNVLVLIVCAIVSWFIVRKAKEFGDDDVLMFLVFPVTGAIVLFMATIHNIHNLILIHNAPKIWFIMEVKNLIS